MKGEKLIGRFKAFIHNISEKDRLAIIYHPDADGLCSALIIAKSIERIKGRRPDLLLNQGQGNIALTEKTAKLLKRKRINKIITADLCLDQNPQPVKEIELFARILILDHHKLYNDLNSKKTVFIKSQHIADLDGSRYPAAKLCYDLFSHLVDIKDLSWIAAAGICGDNALKFWKPFVESAMKQNNLTKKECERLKELINAVDTIDTKKLNSLFKEFYSVKNPKLLLKSKFAEYKKRVDNELEALLKQFKEKKEVYPEIGLVYFLFRSKYNIKSILINKLSNDFYPGKTVVVVLDSGKKWLHTSARRQDFKLKMNDLLENAVKGLPGASAGGHIPAAAGKVKRKDLQKFKKRLIKILRNNYRRS